MPPERALSIQHAGAEDVLRALASRGWSIATAESLTGGLLAAALVAVPGASSHVRGGVVAYATDLKHSILGVDEALLEAHGPVHPDVAAQMAEGVRRVAGRDGMLADVGLSTTGIAGPASPDGQPVGTVHIGVSTPSGTTVTSLRLLGTRAEIRADTVTHALEAALARL
ncbi:CinA family protein [Microbacterium rhizomatis]|uniref:CinA family protein n=1 Tax=Microbacterium rhizomatis TaxID=1631477 RepID=UPI003CCD8588